MGSYAIKVCERRFFCRRERDSYAIRPLILWNIFGAYFLLIGRVGVVEIVLTLHPQELMSGHFLLSNRPYLRNQKDLEWQWSNEHSHEQFRTMWGFRDKGPEIHSNFNMNMAMEIKCHTPLVRLGLSERNSGKIPERPRKRSQSFLLEFPSRVQLGPPPNPSI